MRPEEYIELRYGWLKRCIYNKMYDLSPVFVREAHQISENEYEFYDEDFRPLNKGDIFYTPDGSAFLKCECAVPCELQNKDYYFFFVVILHLQGVIG